MELALSAFAPWLSTFSLQFIDRSFDYRLIGEKRIDKLLYLLGKPTKGLPELTEFFLLGCHLYAYIFISIKNKV
jgi:hypothetical protein